MRCKPHNVDTEPENTENQDVRITYIGSVAAYQYNLAGYHPVTSPLIELKTRRFPLQMWLNEHRLQ